MLVKLPSGETKKTVKQGQLEVTKVSKPTTSGSIVQKPGKPDQKSDKKEVNNRDNYQYIRSFCSFIDACADMLS